MTHLGDAASAFVDDQLDDETRRLMRAHLVGCAGCSADVDAERAVRAHVNAVAEVAPLPEGLLASLLAIADRPLTEPQPVVSRSVRVAPRGRGDAAGPGRRGRRRNRGRRPAGVHPRGRYVAAAGLAASVVVGLGGGSIVNGPSSVAHAPSGPNSSTSTVEVAVTTAPASTVGGATSAVSVPVDERPMLRQQSGAALSVVYRRP